MKLVATLGLALGLVLSSNVTYAKSNQGNVQKKLFVCENGDKATISYLNRNTIELALKYDSKAPKKVRLTREEAASGDYFTATKGFFGYGAEWHEKGREAHLSYDSNEGGMSVSCKYAEDTSRPTHTKTVNFKCENGDRVRVVYMGKKGIELSLHYDVGEPKTVRLQRSKSASGDLYTAKKGFFGYGAEWHEKGKEAVLSFDSNEGGTSLTCKAK